MFNQLNNQEIYQHLSEIKPYLLTASNKYEMNFSINKCFYLTLTNMWDTFDFKNPTFQVMDKLDCIDMKLYLWRPIPASEALDIRPIKIPYTSDNLLQMSHFSFNVKIFPH